MVPMKLSFIMCVSEVLLNFVFVWLAIFTIQAPDQVYDETHLNNVQGPKFY